MSDEASLFERSDVSLAHSFILSELLKVTVSKHFIDLVGNNLATSEILIGDIWILSSVLIEVLKSLSKVTPQFRTVNCTGLLLFAVRKSEGGHPGSDTSNIELVLFLDNVITANGTLPLWRSSFSIFFVFAPFLLIRI